MQTKTICLAAGVLILSEFTGASQSLGAGAILVNPWNITDLSAAISDALTMTDAERRERHRQNYMHISIHTSQTWADTFISELNDTHVEAELRTKHIPPQVGLVAVLLCAVLCFAGLGWAGLGWAAYSMLVPQLAALGWTLCIVVHEVMLWSPI